MAFISMMIAGTALFIMFIGFINFVIALILDFKWRSNSKMNRKTKPVTKFFAVLTSIGGLFMFVIPAAFILIANTVREGKQQIDYLRKDNIVVSEDTDIEADGFEFGGEKLISLDIFDQYFNIDKDAEPLGTVGTDYRNYRNLYSVRNEKDYPIYCIKGLSAGFCPESMADEIRNYYVNEAEYSYSVMFSESSRSFSCEFDRDIFNELAELYDEGKTDFSAEKDSLTGEAFVFGKTSDGIYTKILRFYLLGDDIVIAENQENEKISGISISDEYSRYIKNIFDEFKDK